MKKKILVHTVLAGALTFSTLPSHTFAHDEFGDGVEKGENLAGAELAVLKDKSKPKLLSTFKTEFTEKIPGGATVHDPKVHGNTLYLSHYSGGVRTVDVTDPSQPVETGVYIPSKSNIWGVFVDRNYVLASDMGQGLKVLQKSGGNTETIVE